MRAAVLALAFATLPALGFAQIGNPGFMAPDTRFDAEGMPEPNQPNANDILFAQLVAEGGMAEVALAELAAERAEAEAVTDFANRMIEDHSAANDELAGLGEASGIPLPDGLNAEHQAMRDELEGMKGAEFDLAYMRGQIVDHQKTTQLLMWEITAGQDADLQRFAAATLPTILDHLRAAQEIVTDLTTDQIAEAALEPEPEPEFEPAPEGE